MPATVIVGAQWGDEGKGKVTDYYARRADVVARYQGGNNAGHTIIFSGREFKLHHLPAGVLHPDKKAVIANGVVIDPGVLLEELDDLALKGFQVKNLAISVQAHVIMPWHKTLDALAEGGAAAVGSTRRGIGPVYADKIARTGIRVADLVDPRLLRAALEKLLPGKQRMLEAWGSGDKLALDEIHREHAAYGARLRPFVADTVSVLNDAHEAGKNILLEGAQGTLLDIDHGTYPFVTSSSTTAGGACTGTGLPPQAITGVMGVVKAYTTRVGLGPFPTELKDRVGEHLATIGREVGTTTGRRRRCGWLDLVLLRHAARVNGITAIALTKLDVLAGLGTVRVCVAYRAGGREVRLPPAAGLEGVEPVYRDFPGFGRLELRKTANGMEALPREARTYVEFLQGELRAPVRMVGIGPGREDTIEVA